MMVLNLFWSLSKVWKNSGTFGTRAGLPGLAQDCGHTCSHPRFGQRPIEVLITQPVNLQPVVPR